VFLTDDTSFDRMNAEYHRHFLIEPPARATTIVGLMSPDATIEISLIASTADKQVLGTPMAPSLPFSAGIRAGRWIFLSGVVGNTVINIADTPAQARECLKYLAQTLEASGASFADVVDSTVYLTHLWQTSEIDKIYRDVFPIEPPARTIVGASMVSRGAVIEILVQGYK
jgi:2-iminobutanoate/2-iminopropanoate deaminase